MRKILSLLLFVFVLLSTFSGCMANDNSDNENVTDGTNSMTEEIDFSNVNADMFTGRDTKIDYDESKAVKILLNQNTAVSDSESIKISGSTITITEESTYVVSGELSDGMIIVDAPDTAKIQLVFDGVNITSKTSAALYILNADKVFLTLKEGTTNILSNGGSFTQIDDNNIDAPLFSKQDLTLNGNGKLTITSPNGNGIVCKDDLVITGGEYIVNSASHAFEANDSVRIANSNLTIDAGKDGIHSENTDDTEKGFVYIASGTIKGETEGDGISSGSYMQIENGIIDLTVGGGSVNGSKEQSDSFGGFMGGGRPGGMKPGGMKPGEMSGDRGQQENFENNTTTTEEDSTSMKGLKATGSLVISGGNITINSADDSIHSDNSVVINGGNLNISSGDDGIHAEEKLTVNAGEINITESYEGLEAVHIEISGGDIKSVSSDDGLNAAGGTDQSGFTGGRDGMFGGGGPGMNGGMSGNSDGSIKISGGTLYIKSSGDGMDANGTLEISGGNTVVVGPTVGDTATLDYDVSGTITGGTFLGTGAAGMAQTFSSSSQGVVAVTVGNRSAGTEIVISDVNGNTIISNKPELDFALVILSSPELVKGETYKISIGSDTSEIVAS